MDKKTLRNYILRSTFQEFRPFLVRVLWLLLDMPIKIIVGLSPVMIGLVIFAVVAYLFVLSYFLFFVLPIFLCTNYLEINEMFKILIGLSIPLVILILIRSYFGKILSKFDKLFDLSSHIKNAYEKYKSWRNDILWNIELADRIVPEFPIGGIDDEKIGKFVKIRSKYSRKALANMLPIISELHKMNVGVKSIHESYLSDRFTDEEIKEIFENDYSDSQVEESILIWRDEDQKDKISFMRYLFMFTVLEDGIRKDEWYKLTELLAKLRISRYYIDLLKRDYASLRTEFEEWEKRSTSTEEHKATSALKAYYATLGLEESASDEEVKKAYHALALLHHPDLPKNADRIQECEAMMTKINEAYEKIRG